MSVGGWPGGSARGGLGVRRLLAAGMVLLVAACEDAVDPPAPVDVEIVVTIDVERLLRVERVSVDVTAPDLTAALAFDLVVADGRATGTIVVPSGVDRTITLRAYDGSGRETHRASVTMDVADLFGLTLSPDLNPLLGEPGVELDFDTASVVVLPADVAIVIDDTLQLEAAVVTVSGDTLDAPFTWSSTDTAAVAVDEAGRAVGIAGGEADVIASFGGETGSATVRVEDIVVTSLIEVKPQVFELQLAARAVTGVTVDYWTEEQARMRVVSPPADSHRIVLARLLPAATYGYQIAPDGAGPAAELQSATGNFTTDTLPADLAAVTLTATGALSSGLVMLELRVPTFQGFAAVDSRGRVVWYHATAGSSWGWTRRANGNFVFLDTGDGLTEVTPAGEVVAGLTRAGGEVIHHDVITTPANTLYFMTRHRETIADGSSWLGERVWEWSPESGALDVRWNAFDFLSPTTDVGPLSNTNDWLHTNAISIGVSGNILISSPFLDQVFALTPDFSAIAWRLGGPNATVVPDSAAQFAFQHTASEIAPGRVLLFDNRGSEEGGIPYSRALELDVSGGTAVTAWEFRAPNGNYASIISSARRMDNGNTMVAFGPSSGWRDSIGPIEVYEVAPDGTIVWHLVVQGPNHMYRATPLPDIVGETSLPE